MHKKGQNTVTANKCFGNEARFKYMWMTVKHQNYTHDKIHRRLTLGNAWYYSVYKIFSYLTDT